MLKEYAIDDSNFIGKSLASLTSSDFTPIETKQFIRQNTTRVMLKIKLRRYISSGRYQTINFYAKGMVGIISNVPYCEIKIRNSTTGASSKYKVYLRFYSGRNVEVRFEKEDTTNIGSWSVYEATLYTLDSECFTLDEYNVKCNHFVDNNSSPDKLLSGYGELKTVTLNINDINNYRWLFEAENRGYLFIEIVPEFNNLSLSINDYLAVMYSDINLFYKGLKFCHYDSWFSSNIVKKKFKKNVIIPVDLGDMIVISTKETELFPNSFVNYDLTNVSVLKLYYRFTEEQML